jgi:isoquinoline 1-oxidoreductase
LEPRAAVAEWEGDKITVWTGTQRPFGVRSELAQALGIAEEKARVIVPDNGSGYGGKHSGEAAIEAARLAQEAKKPVKIVWSREEEFVWAYFRPGGVIEVSAGVNKDGTITAWKFNNYNRSAGIRTTTKSPTENYDILQPLRQGSHRALAATANHLPASAYGRIAHTEDGSARISTQEPEDPRAQCLKQQPISLAGKTSANSGHGFGMGGGYEKLGNIATFVEVESDRKSQSVKVVRIVSAFECGAIVNPDNLRAQIEGANIQGLGGALFEAIEFQDGKILNGKMSKYRRFRDLPVVETVLLDRKDLPSAGAGECPMVGLAPAIANAIFDAVGVRLRSLPLIPNGLPIRQESSGNTA